MIDLRLLDAAGLARAQDAVTRDHYLHAPVDVRSMPEGYSVHQQRYRTGPIGFLLFGRPEATRCYNVPTGGTGWYGSVEDVARGRAACTRWQVLNLARVWISPSAQAGGDLHRSSTLPGFYDRRGVWRSTLASTAITAALDRVALDYLLRRPPCFLEEPYQLQWCLSYCDTRLHRGTIYRAAGFELVRTNARGIQTWRRRLRPLTESEDAAVREAAYTHPRSRKHRARRAQLTLY
jgi:hypothetical protein